MVRKRATAVVYQTGEKHFFFFPLSITLHRLFPTMCRCSGQPAEEQSGNRIFVLISIVYTDPPTSLQCLFVLCDHKDANTNWIFGKKRDPRRGARDSCMHTCRYSSNHDDEQGRGCKEMRHGRATLLRPPPKAALTQTQSYRKTGT